MNISHSHTVPVALTSVGPLIFDHLSTQERINFMKTSRDYCQLVTNLAKQEIETLTKSLKDTLKSIHGDTQNEETQEGLRLIDAIVNDSELKRLGLSCRARWRFLLARIF